jgi:hypothetical protein
MSIRLKCRACQTAFVTSDDQVGRPAACPKCGAKQVVPSPGPARQAAAAGPASRPAPEAADVSEASVFVPSERRGRKRRPLVGLAVLALLAVVGTAAVVAWPRLRAWWHPVPPDPVEVAATKYLQALTDQDAEAARKLGTVEDPPAIRSFRSVERDRARDLRRKGSFAPIAALHARINQKYTYDPEIGRFTPKNALGPAAETLDALHDAKAKAEQDELYKKMASGNPDELFDAAEGLGKTFSKLAEGALSPKKLLPTYQQLVDDSKPPLPPTERELALDFAENRETWDALLKRPFLTLKADGPFVLQRAEVRASVIDRLGSAGDPPTTLRLKLVRFRLEGIDTGWKVVSARREQPGEPEPAPKSSAGSRSEHPPEK